MVQVWDQMGTAVKAELVPEHDTLKSLERNLLLRDRTSGPGETERRHLLKGKERAVERWKRVTAASFNKQKDKHLHVVPDPFCPTTVRLVEISTAKAVLVPHPGQSYNPTFEDHQALLSKAVKLEESLKREEERIENLLPRLVGYAAKQRALMKELSEGVSGLHKWQNSRS